MRNLMLLGVVILAGAGFYLAQTRGLLSKHEPPPITETPACASKPIAPLTFPAEYIRRLNQGELKSYLADDTRCFKPGEVMLDPTMYLSADLGFESPHKGKAVISKVEKLDAKNRPADFDTMIAFSGLSKAQQISDLYLVHFEVKLKPWAKKDRSLPHHLNFAKTIERNEQAAVLGNQQAQWVDVEPAAQFARFHKPGAINVPYIKGSATDTNPLSPLEQFQSRDGFDVNALPADKQKPLVFIGADPFDVTVPRALLLAHIGGWKNLYWYYEGEADLQGRLLEAPDSGGRGIAVVVPTGVLELVKSGAQLVDTRPPSNTGSGMVAIENSIHVPYIGSESGYPSGSMTPDNFKRNHESFPLELLPKDKDKPLIFYGTDIYDWAPLKAAIWAQSAGWKKISWLRTGVAAWQSANDVNPKIYKLTENH